MIWDSLLFIDENRNGAKYLKHYFKVQCLTISAQLSQSMHQIPLSTQVQKLTQYQQYCNQQEKVKVLDSLIFWESLHFVAQNKNPAKSENTVPNFRCAPFRMHQVPQVGVTKINLASIILQSTKKFKIFQILDCFGDPSSLLTKIKCSEGPETFLESFVFDQQCALGMSLSI